MTVIARAVVVHKQIKLFNAHSTLQGSDESNMDHLPLLIVSALIQTTLVLVVVMEVPASFERVVVREHP